jgi:hypothetical protein
LQSPLESFKIELTENRKRAHNRRFVLGAPPDTNSFAKRFSVFQPEQTELALHRKLILRRRGSSRWARPSRVRGASSNAPESADAQLIKVRLFVHPFAIALFRHKSHHPPHIPRHRQKVHQPPFVHAGPPRPSSLPPAFCKLCPDSGQRQQCPQLLLLSQAESRANRRVLPEPRAERVRPALHVRAPFATQAFVSASSPAQHF